MSKCLISAQDIEKSVNALAQRLIPHLDETTLVVVLMDGGMPFAADLLRALYLHSHNLECESLKLSSYGDALQTSGKMTQMSHLSRTVAGRHVLILDDVLDTGATLAYAQALIEAQGAKAVTTCVFARKPNGHREYEADLWAWEAPNAFLVGYGLDYKGRYRGQPFISDGINDGPTNQR